MSLLQSGRCLVVLSHADSALNTTPLTDYMTEIQGDPLYELLTQYLGGAAHYLAMNNSAGTEYERQRNQEALQSMVVAVLEAKHGEKWKERTPSQDAG